MDNRVYSMAEISEIVAPIARKYGLPAIFLFGSYARGTPTPASDLDFLVDTTGTGLTSLLKLGALYADLEAAFDKPIDLITVSSIHQPAQLPRDVQFKKAVWKEKVSIYDAA